MTYKLIDCAGADGQRLVDSGVDRSSAAAAIGDGMALALTSVFLSLGLGDEGALIKALQNRLRDCRQLAYQGEGQH